MRARSLLLVAALLGCSGSEGGTPATDDDAAADVDGVDTASDGATDTGASTDATDDTTDDTVADTATVDAAPSDTATSDATTSDGAIDAADATSTDAVADGDAGVCHGVTFGAPAAPITKVTSLPAMTGGTIVEGIYDAIEAKTMGTVTGTYRATWRFVTGMRIEAIEQLAISATPPPPSVRTFTWATAGNSFNRTLVCGGAGTFVNQYRVRVEGAATYLDVRQETVMFTFKKR